LLIVTISLGDWIEFVQLDEQFAVDLIKFEGVVEVHMGSVMTSTCEVWTETAGVRVIVHVAACPTTCELLVTSHAEKLAAVNSSCTCTNVLKSGRPVPSTIYVSRMGLLCACADYALNFIVMFAGVTLEEVKLPNTTWLLPELVEQVAEPTAIPFIIKEQEVAEVIVKESPGKEITNYQSGRIVMLSEA
jgi:hypothetical protein